MDESIAYGAAYGAAYAAGTIVKVAKAIADVQYGNHTNRIVNAAKAGSKEGYRKGVTPKVVEVELLDIKPQTIVNKLSY